MKKIIALTLLLASLLTLFACGKKDYPPVESTEAEKRVVMTLSIDGDIYEVKYELYRAFFLTYKSEVDGGDESVWTGKNKDQYIEKIDERIIDRVAEIYSAFALCKRIGFDIYSKDVEKKIEDNIRMSVEGGSYGNAAIEGFDSYEDYLEALRSMYLNYSVQTLLFRYAIAVDAIDTYYIGTASSDDIDVNMTVGKLEYTKEDVKEFYDSDDSVRVLRASFQKQISYTPLEKAENLKASLEAAASAADTLEEMEKSILNAIMGSGLYSNAAEIKAGYVIGKYNLERSYYGDMTDAAFDLEIGEVSAPIEIVTDVEDAYYVLYRSYKSDEHFEENYESIRYVYLMNCVGKISYDVSEQLEDSVIYTDVLKNINHSEIGM